MNKQVKPTQQRAIDTRNKIIDVAFASFLANGYKKTSTISIAKEAKTSIGIVYSYFKSKDELLELWLNNILEMSDEYFYNQLKLRNYSVEFSMIISNILDKSHDTFFVSPIFYESDNLYVVNTLNSFFNKLEKIFIKACADSNLFLRHPSEVAHVLLNLTISYNLEINKINDLNKNQIKELYVNSICSIFKR